MWSALQFPIELNTQFSAVHFTCAFKFALVKWVELETSPGPFFWKLWHSVSPQWQAPFPCTLIDGWQQQLFWLLAQLVTWQVSLVNMVSSFFLEDYFLKIPVNVGKAFWSFWLFCLYSSPKKQKLFSHTWKHPDFILIFVLEFIKSLGKSFYFSRKYVKI